MQLYYFNLKARNYASLAIAKAGGLNLEYINTFNYPELKPTLPFGQLPLLVDGDIRLAQSNAILRYVADKAGLDGRDDPKYYALSEMLIEEAVDIFNLLGEANKAADKAAAYNALFAADGPIQKHLSFLEKLHPEDTPYFRPDKRIAGGISIAAVLDIAKALEPSVLDNHPKMKLFYETLINSEIFDGIRDLPLWHKRN